MRNVLEGVESGLSFQHNPHRKRLNYLIIKGVDVWKINIDFELKILEMKKLDHDYTFAEWLQIFKNCLDYRDIIDTCAQVLLLLEADKKLIRVNTWHVRRAACLVIDQRTQL